VRLKIISNLRAFADPFVLLSLFPAHQHTTFFFPLFSPGSLSTHDFFFLPFFFRRKPSLPSHEIPQHATMSNLAPGSISGSGGGGGVRYGPWSRPTLPLFGLTSDAGRNSASKWMTKSLATICRLALVIIDDVRAFTRSEC
jgi:hypothetical protein